MIDLFLVTPLVLFVLSAVLVNFVIRRNFSKKIVGNDINKKGEPLVAESCGIALLIPIWGIIVFSSIIFGLDWKMFAVGLALSIFAVIGFLDDNRHKFLSKPLSWKARAIPIALSSLVLAFTLFPPANIFDIVGMFWVVLLSLFFAGVASFSNTFEGLNGWTIGSSFIITAIITLVAITISQELGFMFMTLNAVILGLLIFNRYPAKAFPGDSGTLLIGSSIAGFALFSQNFLFVVFVFCLFIPHMIDFFLLKMITNRSDPTQRKFRPYKLLTSGKLSIPDYPDKHIRYDFAKLVMKIFGPLREWQIVLIIWTIVLVNSIFWAAMFLPLL